ncbi:hypothetical protein B0H13DRAFT_2151011 [Mycena leptocephala]|nr:hypothetical protein B0H13DRAFT_2151011 [Mycena leptocephala]
MDATPGPSTRNTQSKATQTKKGRAGPQSAPKKAGRADSIAEPRPKEAKKMTVPQARALMIGFDTLVYERESAKIANSRHAAATAEKEQARLLEELRLETEKLATVLLRGASEAKKDEGLLKSQAVENEKLQAKLEMRRQFIKLQTQVPAAKSHAGFAGYATFGASSSSFGSLLGQRQP